MFGLIIQIIKFIITMILKVYKPEWLLRLDDWCEDKLGIDIIKENKKFHELYPIIANRINKLERNSHPCKELHEFEAYPDLIARIEKLEKQKSKKK
tara:strand:- start:139 stop:426 length:288 start_codon:yes stop_codon:yes gene_type:complete